jgi:hypothetical protein
LEWVLGLWVKVKTAAGEDIEGRVYTYDPKTHCVALEIPRRSTSTVTPTPHTTQNPQRHDFRILKINYLREITPLPHHPDDQQSATVNGTSGHANNNGTSSLAATSSIFSTALPTVSRIHVERLHTREQVAIKEMGAQLQKIGVGVTQEGQEIFDALSKTLPCRWHKETIVVLDEVLISPPYEIDSCKANASSSASLARVKKVLEGERKRLTHTKK